MANRGNITINKKEKKKQASIVIKPALLRNKQESVGLTTFNKALRICPIDIDIHEEEQTLPKKFRDNPDLVEFMTPV